MIPHNQWRFLSTMVIIGTCFLGDLSCNANKHIKIRKRTAKPAVSVPAKGEPIEIAGALQNNQTYFQTRGVIAMTIKNDALNSGDEFSLLDETTGAKLINKQEVNFGLTETENPDHFSLLANNSYEIILRLYPRSPAFNGKFSYGANKLRLLISEDKDPRFSRDDITLKDFTYFSLATSTFEDDSDGQRQAGFEGRISPLMAPSVPNGKGYLTSEGISLISR